MNNYRNLSDAKSEFYLYLCRQSQNMVYNKTRIRRVQDDWPFTQNKILPTTEEVFQIIKSNSKNSEEFEESIFLVDFKKIKNQNNVNFDVSAWEILQKIKTEINQIFEDMRNNKTIKSGLETIINIQFGQKYSTIFEKINLADFLVCSKVQIIKNKAENSKMQSLKSVDDILVSVEKASGKKCDHCWKVSNVPCERKNCAIK